MTRDPDEVLERCRLRDASHRKCKSTSLLASSLLRLDAFLRHGLRRCPSDVVDFHRLGSDGFRFPPVIS